jgi:hypothetical protein
MHARAEAAGKPANCPENSEPAVVSCNSSSAIDLPCVTIMMKPRSM